MGLVINKLVSKIIFSYSSLFFLFCKFKIYCDSLKINNILILFFYLIHVVIIKIKHEYSYLLKKINKIKDFTLKLFFFSNCFKSKIYE